MKKKFEAVREHTGNVTSTGWTVKTKFNRRWYTVCDVWAGPTGMNAEERAKEIAALLNQSENKPK